jgi:hypothetical protein
MKKARQRAGIDRGIMLANWQLAIDKLRGPPSSSGFQRLFELTERMRAGTDIVETQQRLQKEQAAALANPREQNSEQNKRLAAAIKREINARAAKLKRDGHANPITQAREEVAKLREHASGDALKKWLWRNR